MHGQYRKDGVLTSRILGKRLEKEGPSHYAQALVAPLVYDSGRARVPDLVLAPTQTCTLQLEVTQNAYQPGGVFVCGGGLMLTSNGPRYYIENTTSSSDTTISFQSAAVTPTSNVWSGATVTTGNTLLPGVANIQNSWSGYRVVAAGIQIEFIGNDSNNQGQITAVYQNSMDGSDQTIGITSQATMENFRGNYTGAAKNGALIRYFPIDVEDLVIGEASPATAMTGVSSEGRRWASTTIGDTKNYGFLQWHATNLAASAQFRVTIRVHIEGFIQLEYAGTDTGETFVYPHMLDEILPNASAENMPREGQSVPQQEATKRAFSKLDEGGGFFPRKKVATNK